MGQKLSCFDEFNFPKCLRRKRQNAAMDTVERVTYIKSMTSINPLVMDNLPTDVKNPMAYRNPLSVNSNDDSKLSEFHTDLEIFSPKPNTNNELQNLVRSKSEELLSRHLPSSNLRSVIPSDRVKTTEKKQDITKETYHHPLPYIPSKPKLAFYEDDIERKNLLGSESSTISTGFTASEKCENVTDETGMMKHNNLVTYVHSKPKFESPDTDVSKKNVHGSDSSVVSTGFNFSEKCQEVTDEIGMMNHNTKSLSYMASKPDPESLQKAISMKNALESDGSTISTGFTVSENFQEAIDEAGMMKYNQPPYVPSKPTLDSLGKLIHSKHLQESDKCSISSTGFTVSEECPLVTDDRSHRFPLQLSLDFVEKHIGNNLQELDKHAFGSSSSAEALITDDSEKFLNLSGKDSKIPPKIPPRNLKKVPN